MTHPEHGRRPDVLSNEGRSEFDLELADTMLRMIEQNEGSMDGLQQKLESALSGAFDAFQNKQEVDLPSVPAPPMAPVPDPPAPLPLPQASLAVTETEAGAERVDFDATFLGRPAAEDSPLTAAPAPPASFMLEPEVFPEVTPADAPQVLESAQDQTADSSLETMEEDLRYRLENQSSSWFRTLEMLGEWADSVEERLYPIEQKLRRLASNGGISG